MPDCDSDGSDSLELLDIDEIPEDAGLTQCGRVVTNEGVVGRIDTETSTEEE